MKTFFSGLGSLVSGAFSWAGSLFGGLGIWGYVASAVVAAGLAAYLVHHYDLADLNALKLADANAKVIAVQAAKDDLAARDKVTLTSALKEAAAQTKIVTNTVIIKQEIPVYVTAKQDAATCITYGLVSVYNAAAGQPNAVPIPTGQSYDTCAPVKASDLARGIADNFGIAGQNAEQLNALEDWVKQQEAVQLPKA